MVSWMFAYVQTHQFVHIKFVPFFVYQFYLHKVIYFFIFSKNKIESQ